MLKDRKAVVIYVGMAIVFALLMYHEFGSALTWINAKNPDPNHTHADFAVWVNGTKLDFSDARYMSEVPKATSFQFHLIPQASAHLGEEEEEHAGQVIPGREYLHLHDGNGSVIHRHKPGLTLKDFFASIGLTLTDTCFTLDDFQFKKLDAAWVKDFGRTKKLCDDGKFHWTMMVNGAQVPLKAAYDFADGDKILLSYGSSDTAAAEQYKEMTDEACRYSKTCPWRGVPPTENCIADPTVPCVVQ
jgi:hypothetical protein